eukprot:TRINITY_DN121964_c0_g1_i1.p1 TRINITY_DN121964_c0_g1~~TRINITY_DN121964_c0_g1_i1.p1  ORF type:complete len:968 (+),score=282.91 TRINITY_DN121964_c0_g1_i1:93-2996(+)
MAPLLGRSIMRSTLQNPAWVALLSAVVFGVAAGGRNEASSVKASVELGRLARLLPEVEDEREDDAGRPLAFLEIGSQEHMAKLRSNMTTEQALHQLPPDVRKAFRQLLPASPSAPASSSADAEAWHVARGQEGASPGGTAFLQARTTHRTASVGAMKLAAQVASNSSKHMSVDEARQSLNKMAEEAEAKLDEEKAKCATAVGKQQQMIDDAYQDMTDYDAQGAAARGRIVETQTIIERSHEDLAKLEGEMPEHHEKCEKDAGALKKEMGLLEEDTKILEAILAESKCGKKPAASSLLVCKDKLNKTEDDLPEYDERTTHITFRHAHLRRKASMLQSGAARKALQRGLSEAVSSEEHRHRMRKKLTHRGDGRAVARRLRHHSGVAAHRPAHRRERGPRLRSADEVAEDIEAEDESLADEMLLQTRRAKHQGQSSAAKHHKTTHHKASRQKCTARAAPSCDVMRDSFLNMRAELEDKLDELRSSLDRTTHMCSMTEDTFHSTAEELVHRLEAAELGLTEATKVTTEATEQLRIRTQQVAQLQAEGNNMKAECEKTMQSLALDICGMKQIRQELYKMQSEKPFIQDCEVSRWTPDACSASCGGGVQTVRRTIILPDDKGTACPKLVMQKECGSGPCPEDCRMEEWSGWSACTAKCGGGVKERVRGVRRQARHGGQPCAATAQTESCGNEPCDADCRLAAWSPWSTCSRACGGGFEIRERLVVAAAKGDGLCPVQDSPSRLQYKRCNPQECKPASGGTTLQCDSKLDVIILLDSSGSVGSEGWEKLKTATSTLVKAFNPDGKEDGAAVSVLMYGGPDDFENYKKCTNGDAIKDMEKECKISWASHLTTDASSVSGGLGQLAWQKGATLTSAALAAAETELLTGRPATQSVVIVLTDGRPMNMRKTTEIAARLKRRARLMWVPLTDQAPIDQMKHWASRPVASNVLALKNIAELEKPDRISGIIADACPKVK